MRDRNKFSKMLFLSDPKTLGSRGSRLKVKRKKKPLSFARVLTKNIQKVRLAQRSTPKTL